MIAISLGVSSRVVFMVIRLTPDSLISAVNCRYEKYVYSGGSSR
jgi:hypothetical protein